MYWDLKLGGQTIALSVSYPFLAAFCIAVLLGDGTFTRGQLLWVAGMVGTFLTGLYAFRMLFIVFWGEPSAFVSSWVR